MSLSLFVSFFEVFGIRQADNSDQPLRQLIYSLRKAKNLGRIEATNKVFKAIHKGSVGSGDLGDFYKITINPRSTSADESIDELTVETSGPGKGVYVLSFSLEGGVFSPNEPFAVANQAPVTVGNSGFGDSNAGFLRSGLTIEGDSKGGFPVKTVYIQVTPISGMSSYTLKVKSSRDKSYKISDLPSGKRSLRDNSLNLFSASLKQAKNLGTVESSEQKPLKLDGGKISLNGFSLKDNEVAPAAKLTINPGTDEFGSITIRNNSKGVLSNNGTPSKRDDVMEDVSVRSFILNKGFITSYSPYSVLAGKSSYLPGPFSNFTEQPTNLYTQIAPNFVRAERRIGSVNCDIAIDLFR